MPAGLEPIASVLARVFTDRRRCPVCGHRGPTFTEPTCGVRRCLCCLEACCRDVQAETENTGLPLPDIALCFLEDVAGVIFSPATVP